MRIINHLIFVGATAGAIILAVVKWSWLWTFTSVDLYPITGRQVPLNLLVLVACLGVLFLQWLAVQGAWIFRNKKLERAEKEITRLKVRLYDLTEGSMLDEIKGAIKETRKELREDIKWLAGQPYHSPPVQVVEGEPQRELPPLLNEGRE